MCLLNWLIPGDAGGKVCASDSEAESQNAKTGLVRHKGRFAFSVGSTDPQTVLALSKRTAKNQS
jgi:hypothetical protein